MTSIEARKLGLGDELSVYLDDVLLPIKNLTIHCEDYTDTARLCIEIRVQSEGALETFAEEGWTIETTKGKTPIAKKHFQLSSLTIDATSEGDHADED